MLGIEDRATLVAQLDESEEAVARRAQLAEMLKIGQFTPEPLITVLTLCGRAHQESNR